MSDATWADLTPYLTGGWLKGGWFSPGQYPFGFYTHRDRCYLQGQIVNPRALDITAAAVTATILTGLPPDVRPAEDTAVTVLVNLWQTADQPGLAFPRSIAATATASGALVLSAVPSQANEIPPDFYHVDPTIPPGDPGYGDHIPDFTTALGLALIIGNISWPIPGGPASDDDMEWRSLGDFMTEADDFENIDAEIAVHQTRVHLRGTIRARRDNGNLISRGVDAAYRDGLAPSGGFYERNFTTAAGLGGEVGIEVDNDGSMMLINDEEADTALPELGSWIEPDEVHGIFAGLQHLPDRQIDTWSGAISHPTVEGPDQWDYGMHFGPCGTDELGNPIWCPTLGDSGETSVSLAEILAKYYPQPDWFVVSVQSFLSDGTAAEHIFKGVSTCRLDGDGHPIGCGDYVNAGELELINDAGGTYVSGIDGSALLATAPDASGAADATAFHDNVGGCIERASGGYTGAPSNRASVLLWQPGELDSVTIRLSDPTNRGTLGMTVTLVPFWQQRNVSVKAGSIVTLDGGGWQALMRLVNGNVDAGAGPSGLHRRARVIAGRSAPTSLAGSGTFPAGASGNLDGAGGESGIVR